MSDRTASLSRFLNASVWTDWIKTPIAQDASARSYMRLSQGVKSAILMDAPPGKNQDIRTFVKMTDMLHAMNLAVPAILAEDMEHGFLMLEDLGTTDFAKAILTDPDCAEELYKAAADILIHIAGQPAPDLHKMDPVTAGDMVRITAEFYAQTPAMADTLAMATTDMFQTFCGPADTLALRDFHAENLIWRPGESGLQRVGLLDYQDAFIAPSGYDLASLLRDARRDIDSDFAAGITAYVAQKTDEPFDQLALRIRCLAVQRNLRILGVFSRLIRVEGKTRYAQMIPRVWRYLDQDLDHPSLADMRKLFRECLPKALP